MIWMLGSMLAGLPRSEKPGGDHCRRMEAFTESDTVEATEAAMAIIGGSDMSSVACDDGDAEDDGGVYNGEE
jgi:hypothetical protein